VPKLQKYYIGTWMRDRNSHTNRPVTTARAVVQRYNAAVHITMHNTQRQFGCLPINITS